LIAGHRRKRGSELAGKDTMPIIVRDLDDDESTIIMVDSNLQRENLLPSEKAWAYKMKLDAIKRQGTRTDLTSAQVGQKSQVSVEIVAEEAGESRNQVKRFIRLTELLPALLQMVDDKKLAFNPAVELSYLTQDEQKWLIKAMNDLETFPSLAQAGRLKKYSQDGNLNEAVIDAILTEEHTASVQVTLKGDQLKRYFPQNYTQKQVEKIIFSLLETWRTQNQ
ncbi:MAG: chromosome partitioning protein ParB, partial [Clostridia bacterium]